MRTSLLPSKKQLEFCYGILKRIGTCDADEYGQPLFETSMAEADKFIKKHRTYPSRNISDRSDNCSAGDWGGIPNH